MGAGGEGYRADRTGLIERGAKRLSGGGTSDRRVRRNAFAELFFTSIARTDSASASRRRRTSAEKQTLRSGCRPGDGCAGKREFLGPDQGLRHSGHCPLRNRRSGLVGARCRGHAGDPADNRPVTEGLYRRARVSELAWRCGDGNRSRRGLSVRGSSVAPRHRFAARTRAGTSCGPRGRGSCSGHPARNFKMEAEIVAGDCRGIVGLRTTTLFRQSAVIRRLRRCSGGDREKQRRLQGIPRLA